MTPDQLNAAATALTPPTGGVASLEPGDNGTDDSSEDDGEGEATAKIGNMTSGENHMTNGRSRMTVSSSDEGGVSSDNEDGRELTKAEALAALRNKRKSTTKQQKSTNKSVNTTSGKEKGVRVCVRVRVCMCVHVCACVCMCVCE